MIAWVNARLVAWGEWRAGSRTGGGGGAGYPAYRLVHIHSTVGYQAPCNADVMQMDRIMAHVKVHRPDLYDVAESKYVHALSAGLIAGRLRCHVRTVHARVEFLHRFVEKRMSERLAR